MPMSTLTSTTRERVGFSRAPEANRAVPALREDRDRGLPAPKPGRPPGGAPLNEPWVTKRQLASHLQVTERWIELQHPDGLPHLRRGGIVRYRISEVDSWLLSSSRAGGADAV
jgi:hypothetical protein